MFDRAVNSQLVHAEETKVNFSFYIVHLLLLALDLRSEQNIGHMCLLEIFNCISVKHWFDYPMRGQ